MKPKPPIHCGKPAKHYVHLYKTADGKVCHSIEAGYRCYVCGRIRIAGDDAGFSEAEKARMAVEADRVREAGIAFDESLGKP